ncbi:MAG: D-alanyl-D-alanine carboxypeptidase [Gammaproteobacteria bacterium]|nr:D-alanyl-D-alanine carboxypeptidase [Gammaproteobacteria bacterium]
MKKLLIAGLALGFSAVAQAQTASIPVVPAAPQIAASSYILMDANSGQVLIEHNADERLPPASLAKMMTSYIGSLELLEGRISEQDEVLVSERAWRKGGSKMFIEVGDRVPFIDLKRGVIIQSGNDASIAMAEHIAGSEDAFADLMNSHAQRLGMRNTNFTNATGWPDDAMYSSARDMAILAQAVIRDDQQYYDIYKEREFTWNGIRQTNRNRMLWRDSSVDGLKTGHTEAAGYCLVASAEREGMRLISVVMGTSSDQVRTAETQKLMTWGFRFFETRNFYQPGEVLATPRVWAGVDNQVRAGLADGLLLTLPRGQSERLQASVNLKSTLRAPIVVGDELGEVEVRMGDEVVHRAPLVALADVERAGIFGRLWDGLRLFFYGLFN